MNFPCGCHVNCPGTDSPFANLSSEPADQISFFAFNFGWGNNVPPLGDSFTKAGCVANCTSTISQQDADFCASRQQLECLVDGGPTDPGGPGWTDPGGNQVPIFTNGNVSCTGHCPDGLPFTFTIAAGTFAGLTQLQADRIAFSFACFGVANNILCLSSIPTEACRNQAYNATITATSHFPVLFWSFGGDFPVGLNISFSGQTATITGKAQNEGTHEFSVTAVDTQGNSMTKNYTICVIDIGPTNTTLPNAAPNLAYSQQMTATSCATAPLSWAIVGGALPAGLTLNPITGIISGTPTSSGTFTFLVQVQTAAT